jgi:hypothetical protein
MVDRICGPTKLYRHKDIPDALMRMSKKIPKKEGNPHLPVYDVKDLEQAVKLFEEEFNVSIPNIYVKIDPKQKVPYNI